MGSDEKQIPVKIDLGIAAKAEVKTEIPGESSGRLLDALTDAIRPWTEKRGLRADQIRLQREEVLIAIAHKAKERARIEGIQIEPVPNKTLVPLLEKASLEDPDSPLVDWWANLLVSAADPNTDVRPYFAELVSQIGSSEAKFLDELWTKFNAYIGDEQHLITDFGSELIKVVREKFGKTVHSDSELSGTEWRYDVYGRLRQEAHSLVDFGEKIGVPWKFTFPRLDQEYWHSDVISVGSEMFIIYAVEIDICCAINLLRDVEYTEPFAAMGLAGSKYEVRILQFTELGISFMNACRPDKPSFM